jgi:hypothetical protein
MEGQNINYTVTFTDAGTFATEGSYDIATSVTSQGITQSYTYSVDDVSGVGNYETEQPNIIRLSGGFYDIAVDGVDTSALQDEQQEGEYSISADGQTLIITQNIQETLVEEGLESTTTISSTSTYTRM